MVVNDIIASRDEAICVRFDGATLHTHVLPCVALRKPQFDEIEDECNFESLQPAEEYPDENDFHPHTHNRYHGSYAQDVMGRSDQFIDEVLGGDAEMYWNID